MLSIPVSIIFFFREKFSSSYFSLAVFVLLTSITSIVIFQMVPTIDNTYQFVYVGYVSIYFITIFILVNLFQSLQLLKKYIFLFISITLGIVSLKNNYHSLDINETIELNYLQRRGFDAKTIREVKDLIKNKNNMEIVKAAFIVSNENTLAPSHKHSLTYQYGNDFKILNNVLQLYPLTPPNMLYQDTNNSIKYNRATSFNEKIKFYHNYTNGNDEKYINNYIKKENISFVITDKKHFSIDVPTIVIPKN